MLGSIEKPYAVVLGSLHLDYIVDIPYLPHKGETLSGSNLKIIPGGKGGNQAYYLSLQGIKTVMLGKTGTDTMSQQLTTSLTDVGVDCSRMVQDETAASGMSVAMVTEDKDYSAVIISGANMNIDEEYIDSVLDVLLNASVLVLQFEIPLAVISYAVKKLKDSPCKVILNAAPAYKSQGILEYTDILVVNEVEGGMLSGIAITDTESAIKATSVLNDTVPTVITTLGSKGLVYSENKNKPVFLPAYTVDVVDSHGAGDSFVGGLSARIAEGESISEAVKYAMGVAALSVQQKGPKARNAVPENVTAFLASRQ